jgi:hypothetical protein
MGASVANLVAGQIRRHHEAPKLLKVTVGDRTVVYCAEREVVELGMCI